VDSVDLKLPKIDLEVPKIWKAPTVGLFGRNVRHPVLSKRLANKDRRDLENLKTGRGTAYRAAYWAGSGRAAA
jgi:hypothetical protein